MRTWIMVFLACVFLSGCGAHVGTMQYHPSLPAVQPKVENDAAVYIAPFKDLRDGGRRSPARIGRLVGGFGETLKSIELNRPLTDSVGDMFSDFMTKNGVNVVRSGAMPHDGYTLSGDINSFFCAFYYMHNANMNINLVLTENSTGRKVWESSIDDHFSGGNIFNRYTALQSDPTIACFGYDCHAKGVNYAMNMMLSDGINNVWDKGGLRAALANPDGINKDNKD